MQREPTKFSSAATVAQLPSLPGWLRAMGVVLVLMTFVAGIPGSEAFARKTNQSVYEDPFDLAAGGASLTRASQVGVLFANPAQLSYGGKFHRWLGSESILVVNKESVDTVKDMASGKSDSSSDSSADSSEGSAEGNEAGGESGGASESGDSATAGSSGTAEFVDKLFTDPLHFGTANSFGYINRFFGLATFQRFNLDVKARRYGETGLPEISVKAESYYGAQAGMPVWTPFRWLALGVGAKYVFASEPDLTVEVTDEEKINSLKDPSAMKSLVSHNRGFGADAGALMFFQGRHLDYSLALKADDVGDTKLVGDNDLKKFKQVLSVGAGMTFHTVGDGLHLAIDYRDVQNAYEEALFKKIYMGTKLTIRSYVGLAAGLYNGYPTVGAEVDFIFFRLSGTYYTREMGDHPDVEPRNIYMLSFAAGM